MGDLILWGVVLVVMVVAELSTMQLISIWFAAGALASFIVALCGMGMGFQMFVFILVSVLLLSVTRPLFAKFRVGDTQPTNMELDIGKTALIIEEVNNAADKGRARLNGVDWKAVSTDNSIIPEGSVVTINDIKGTKLFVTIVKETVNK